MVSTASAEEANISVLLLCVSAWHSASRAMLRIERRGRLGGADAAGRSAIVSEPSIGRGP